MTDYVATRWYRAPEIITGWVEYTKAVDMWAVGCILAELLGRKPLWPGSDSQHQLELICQCVGKPHPETIARIQTPEIRDFVLSIPNNRPVQFHDLYPDANPKACDLLRELLIFEPEKRCDVEAALDHPYLAQLHFPDDEPRGPEIPLDAFQFEMRDLDADELKREILREIWFYHWDARNSSRSSDDDVMFAVLPFEPRPLPSFFFFSPRDRRPSRRRTPPAPRPSRTTWPPKSTSLVWLHQHQGIPARGLRLSFQCRRPPTTRQARRATSAPPRFLVLTRKRIATAVPPILIINLLPARASPGGLLSASGPWRGSSCPSPFFRRRASTGVGPRGPVRCRRT